MRFDWTLNAGHVLTAGSMVAAVILSYSNLRQEIALQDFRVQVIERTLSAMADQNTRITVIERSIINLPDKLDDLAGTLRRIEGQQP